MSALAQSLRTLADLAEHIPAEMVSVHPSGVIVIVSNELTQARWHDAFGRLPAMPDVDVRVEALWDAA